MTPIARSLLFAALASCGAATQAQQPSAPARGHLLYDTHCIECHTTQVHWRDRRQARDWPSLWVEVDRWQAAARLQWSEADVTEVARYLDRTIYHFAPDARSQGRVAPD
ncbi:MAG: cytochrome C [Burkholderiales bacterium]|nr:cytochrome C [Burkholderiales bacterium]